MTGGDHSTNALNVQLAKMAAYLDDVRKSIARLEKLDEKQTKILELLAANKVEHEAMQHDIQILRDRTHNFANKIHVVDAIYEKEKRQEMRLDDLEARLETMEKKMPVVDMASGWVFKFAIGVMALLGLQAFYVVLKFNGG